MNYSMNHLDKKEASSILVAALVTMLLCNGLSLHGEVKIVTQHTQIDSIVHVSSP